MIISLLVPIGIKRWIKDLFDPGCPHSFSTKEADPPCEHCKRKISEIYKKQN